MKTLIKGGRLIDPDTNTDKIMDIVRTCGGFLVCDEIHTDWKTLHRYTRLELRCTDNQFENIKMKIDRLWYHNIEIKTY